MGEIVVEDENEANEVVAEEEEPRITDAHALEILKANRFEIDPTDPASPSAIVERLGLAVTPQEATVVVVPETPSE